VLRAQLEISESPGIHSNGWLIASRWGYENPDAGIRATSLVLTGELFVEPLNCGFDERVVL
jgi:hypothetical protein